MLEIGFDPIIAQLGWFQLSWHGVATSAAVVVGVWLGLRRAERLGFDAAALGELVTWSLVGGLVGARLFHVLDHLPIYLERPLTALAIWEGGIAVYGAFIGGILGGTLAARRSHLPPWPLLDAAAPALLVGQAIGRLGCLSNGDAWGAPTGGAWGVVYTHASALIPPELLGVPTHPYPLYEIAADLLLMAALLVLGRRLRQDGSLFLVAVLGYAAIRFALTTVRQEAIVLAGLQEAQVVALATATVAMALLVVRAMGLAVPAPRPSE